MPAWQQLRNYFRHVRKWVLALSAAIGAWGIIYLFSPSTAKTVLLIAGTYWESQASMPVWRLLGYSAQWTTAMCAILGGASATTLWMLTYRDLVFKNASIPRRLQFLFPPQPKVGRNNMSWARCGRWAFAMSMMLFVSVINGLIAARTVKVNRWLALAMTLIASTARNVVLGLYLLPMFSLWHEALLCSSALAITVAVSAYKRRRVRERFPQPAPELAAEIAAEE